jgi:hypothetical protein
MPTSNSLPTGASLILAMVVLAGCAGSPTASGPSYSDYRPFPLANMKDQTWCLQWTWDRDWHYWQVDFDNLSRAEQAQIESLCEDGQLPSTTPAYVGSDYDRHYQGQIRRPFAGVYHHQG